MSLQSVRLNIVPVDRILVSVSIGIASGEVNYFYQCENLLDRKISAAEAANREAKKNRKTELAKDRIFTWTDSMGIESATKDKIESRLRDPNVFNEMWIVYQPIVDMTTNEIVGAEALLRWQTEDGFISPAEFIPIAETSGSIFSISAFVIKNTIKQIIRCQKYKPSFYVSINVSPQELDDAFAETIFKSLDDAELRYDSLSIEITERGVAENIKKYHEIIERFKKSMLVIKIDDFPTGNSGIKEIIDIRPQDIKVDRSVIPKNREDLDGIAICKAVLGLSKSLGFGVILEGVETAEQKEFMIEMGFVIAQGFYFHKPMMSEDLIKLLIDE
jgi:EAL domain-containing protein (putative c-di-GMP-specific phosphodiesterase class I)